MKERGTKGVGYIGFKSMIRRKKEEKRQKMRRSLGEDENGEYARGYLLLSLPRRIII
jgi:hypothetical protein